MSKTEPFETRFLEYDAWFDRNPNVFESEALAVRRLLPTTGRIVEVGVGSGRFASRLGIEEGVEPAEGIARLAKARGVTVLKGVAEALPLEDSSCDALLYVTTLCFVDDVPRTWREARRVLRAGGSVVVAFIPRGSRFGLLYEQEKVKDPFYRLATFYSTEEVLHALIEAGLEPREVVQTLTGSPETANEAVEPPSEGWGRGSFVVVRAVKTEERRVTG